MIQFIKSIEKWVWYTLAAILLSIRVLANLVSLPAALCFVYLAYDAYKEN